MDFNAIVKEILGHGGMDTVKEKLSEIHVGVLTGGVFFYLFMLIVATKLIISISLLTLLSLYIVNKVTGGIFK